MFDLDSWTYIRIFATNEQPYTAAILALGGHGSNNLIGFTPNLPSLSAWRGGVKWGRNQIEHITVQYYIKIMNRHRKKINK